MHNSKKIKWYHICGGFIILSIVLMIFFSFYSNYQSGEAEKARNHWKSTVNSSDYKEVETSTLYSDASKFIRKNVITTVEIANVERITNGVIQANINNHDSNYYDFCFMFDDINEPMTYNPGERVTIAGTVTKRNDVSRTVTLEHCHIIAYN